MGTVRQYISEKLTRVGVQLSESELDTLLIESGVDGALVFSADNVKEAKKAIVAIIPDLLLQPDITEGGYSIKQNRDGILAYYRNLCAELGIENKVDSGPKVHNKSYLW